MRMAPGDPYTLLAAHPSIPEAVRVKMVEDAGLNQPISTQFLLYLRNVVSGDLGWSLSQHRPVAHVLRGAIPYTVLLAGLSVALAFALGVATGVYQSLRPGSLPDRVISSVTMVFNSLPDFWLGLLLISAFSLAWPVLPVGGAFDAISYEYLGAGEKIINRIRHLILPVLTLTLILSAAVARHQRSSMLEVLPSRFISYATAKGISSRRVIWRHALQNALSPTITMLGFSIPVIFTGAVFVEKVFAWPGIGWTLLNGVAARDYPLVTAGVILTSFTVVAGSELADVLLKLVDPRLRESNIRLTPTDIEGRG